MGISKLTDLAPLLAMMAVSTGQLPRILKVLRKPKQTLETTSSHRLNGY